VPANGLRGNPQTARNSCFHTAATAAGLRLHFQCFLKLGAQVVVSVRRIVLHHAENFIVAAVVTVCAGAVV
jgi:hypothetical protein